MPRHRLPAALAGAALLVLSGTSGAAAVQIAAAPPAQAAAAAAAHPTITVTGPDGSHGGTAADLDGSSGNTFTLAVNGLSCDDSANFQFGGPSAALRLFWTSPALAGPVAATTQTITDVVDATGSGQVGWMAAVPAGSDPVGSDGTISASTTLFPSANANWFGSTQSDGQAELFRGGNIANTIEIVTGGSDAGTYSIGVACVESGTSFPGNAGAGNAPGLGGLEFDSDGNALIAWSTLTINTDGSWTVDDSASTTPPPANPASTTTALTASKSNGSTTDSVTLTATVSPADAAGTVQFADGSAKIGQPVEVSNGKATTTVSSWTAGAHSLTAAFTPTDSTAFAASTSSAVTFTATAPPPAKADTTVTLSDAPDATTPTTDVLTATVQSGGSTLSSAAGTVAFSDGGTALGTATPSNGVATFTAAGLAAGTTHRFTAVYTAAASEQLNDSKASNTVTDTLPDALALDGSGVITPGKEYLVTVPAGGAFKAGAAGDTVTASIDDPIAAGSATIASDGSLELVIPASATSQLTAGASGTLTLTDTTASPAITDTVAFTVASAAPGSTGGGGKHAASGGSSGGSAGAPGSNDPVSFATGLAGETFAQHPFVSALVGGVIIVLVAAAGALIWMRRRGIRLWASGARRARLRDDAGRKRWPGVSGRKPDRAHPHLAHLAHDPRQQHAATTARPIPG